ncbi:GNAT family N-acetyltransferase [Bacillus altitudinis]|uniref:GNAT family N-acetyltransferase n=1 Tax=Bacillus altitudinis TaxID=293387 RepID=UPI003CED0FCB
MILIRVAITLDYPQLRKIYFESHRQSFHWLNTEEMHLHDLDRNTLEEQIYLAEIRRFISLYVLNCFIRLLSVHPEACRSRSWKAVAEEEPRAEYWVLVYEEM